MTTTAWTWTAAVALACGVSFGAHGQGAQEFYKNKQIRLIVGHPVGNDHDVGGRLLARYLGRHIPGNPGLVVQNMPGANGVRAASHVYSVAAKDGTVLGIFDQAMMPSK